MAEAHYTGLYLLLQATHYDIRSVAHKVPSMQQTAGGTQQHDRPEWPLSRSASGLPGSITCVDQQHCMDSSLASAADVTASAESLLVPRQSAVDTSQAHNASCRPEHLLVSAAEQITSSNYQTHAACAVTSVVDAEIEIPGQPAASEESNLTQHAETPHDLPDQLSQLRQHYHNAKLARGTEAAKMIGQRVAFVLLEKFEQRDRGGAVDVLTHGVHVGQYVMTATVLMCMCLLFTVLC